MANPKNIEELRDQLLDAYGWVKSDPRRANQVKEMANTAGKVIGTLKLQLEYALLRKEKPYIPFLGKTGGDAMLEEIHGEIDPKKDDE